MTSIRPKASRAVFVLRTDDRLQARLSSARSALFAMVHADPGKPAPLA
jgi:hypothetical protein